MVDGEKRAEGGWPAVHRRPRRLAMAGIAVVLGTGLGVGCGSSSSDSKAATDASTPAPATKPAVAAASTAAPAPTPSAAQKFEALQDRKGTMRLAAVPFGEEGGKLIVKPAGLVYETDHYYKPGTVVRLRPRPSSKVRFTGWAGACTARKRTCTVRMDGKVRVIAGFGPK